jgi:hypothetical protein
MQLHQSVISDICVSEGVATLADTEVINATGELNLHDHIARDLQRVFVETTRFDPLHNAQTEQQIYDSIPDWLERLRSSERIPVEVAYSGQTYQTVLSRAQLADSSSKIVQTLSSALARASGPIVVEGLLLDLMQLHGVENNPLVSVDTDVHKACESLQTQLHGHVGACYLESLRISERSKAASQEIQTVVEEQNHRDPDAKSGTPAGNTSDGVLPQLAPTTPDLRSVDSQPLEVSLKATHLLVGNKAYRGNYFVTLQEHSVALSAEKPSLCLGQIEINGSGDISLTPFSNDLTINGDGPGGPVALQVGDRIAYLPLGTCMVAIQVVADETATS